MTTSLACSAVLRHVGQDQGPGQRSAVAMTPFRRHARCRRGGAVDSASLAGIMVSSFEWERGFRHGAGEADDGQDPADWGAGGRISGAEGGRPERARGRSRV